MDVAQALKKLMETLQPLETSKQTHKEYSHGESKTKFAETVSANLREVPPIISKVAVFMG